MFCRKKQYLKIQKIHHKALKVVYNSNKNYDEDILHKIKRKNLKLGEWIMQKFVNYLFS